MDKDINKQKERIAKIFPKEIEDIFKCSETLEKYREFLISKLDNPVEVTGIEDFDWEEFMFLDLEVKKNMKGLRKRDHHTLINIFWIQ